MIAEKLLVLVDTVDRTESMIDFALSLPAQGSKIIHVLYVVAPSKVGGTAALLTRRRVAERLGKLARSRLPRCQGSEDNAQTTVISVEVEYGDFIERAVDIAVAGEFQVVIVESRQRALPLRSLITGATVTVFPAQDGEVVPGSERRRENPSRVVGT
jgi:hypothetical protein